MHFRTESPLELFMDRLIKCGTLEKRINYLCSQTNTAKNPNEVISALTRVLGHYIFTKSISSRDLVVELKNIVTAIQTMADLKGMDVPMIEIHLESCKENITLNKNSSGTLKPYLPNRGKK